MSDLFEDGDSDIEIRTDNEYAKKYDTWRKKEELHKLETKYGKDVLDYSDAEPSESSSDEDEDAEQLTEDIQNKFLKTLTLLRSNDPIIYNENVNFFDDKNEVVSKIKTKPLPNATLFTKDIVDSETNDESGSENEEPESSTAQDQVKFTNLFGQEEIDMLNGEERDEPTNKPELPVKVKKRKAKIEVKATEDESYRFVMDCILNKRFFFKKDQDVEASSSKKNEQDDLSEDENDFAKQEEFEYKYNFRFEEPDKEFIKQFPRSIPTSLRIPDDSRKLKRAATKERKQKEKEEKLQELKKMQELKRSEIEEKIKKLKEVTGTTEVEFEDGDIDGDFDPEAHDRRMQALFNDDFYEGEEMQKKPEFPELDEYLEIENWDKWDGEKDEAEEIDEVDGADEDDPHCEDEDFNMDCDYDPRSASAKKKEIIEKFKDKRKRKRKSLFAKVLSESKPTFDPNDKTYEEYLDEYYKFDCEDLIGDLPCRFKYRKVVPNSFGLSVEEILAAKDKELNKWCSIKKTLQRRPDHVEKYDQVEYEKKRDNIQLKRRLLPSLFVETGESSKSEQKGEPEGPGTSEHNEVTSTEPNEPKSEVEQGVIKKKKKKTIREQSNTNNVDSEEEKPNNATLTATKKRKKKKNKKSKISSISESKGEMKQLDSDSKEEGEVPKKKDKQKIKKPKKTNVIDEVRKSRKRKISNDGLQEESSNATKKRKSNKGGMKGNKKSIDVGMSDARLSAYGLNPKKFKNKLIYGNTNNQK